MGNQRLMLKQVLAVVIAVLALRGKKSRFDDLQV
jgi:hypothetical protein